jgi:hypothetical protein
MGSDEPVCYHHLLLEDHQVLLANGIPAESLFLGPRCIGQVASDDEHLLPGLGWPDRRVRPARPFATVTEGAAFLS